MQFRYDINGLRAISILAVLIFHFNPHWLPGGFAGVDVFFVISGFLMTSIIFNGIEKNTFNLFKFYNARANRIIPVLTVMSAVLLIFGWFYLLPNDYSDLGKQIEKSSLFISNLLFAKGGGYFDTAEHTKWLLHTWSLSVEWQFYILFPILIIILKKYLNFKNLRHIVLFLFLASFSYCIYATYKDSKTAYFLLTSRAWEMLLGGLAFLYPWSIKNKLHQIMTQYLGIIMIITSCFLITEDIPWPGYMALIPVFGAYLIIVSNFQNNFIFLNNPLMNNIGKWSYSIYVWHWPLVVLGFYFTLENWWMYGIPLSILLGFLSYQFIEKLNFKIYSSWKDIYKVKPVYMFLIIFTCGYAVKKTNGMEFHYSAEVINLLSEHKNSFPYQCKTGLTNGEIDVCKIGQANSIGAIIVGDSHAKSITSAVATLFDFKKNSILSITTAGCPYIPNAHFDNNYCEIANDKKHAFLKETKGIPIIFVNRYLLRIEGESDPERTQSNKITLYFSNGKVKKDDIYTEFENNLQTAICELTPNSPVYLVTSIPEFSFNVPKTMAKQSLKHKTILQNTMPLDEYNKRAARLNNILYRVAKKCDAHVLNVSNVLCKNGECISQLNGKPIYRDGDHLSEYGNKLLVPIFKDILIKN